MEDFNPDEESMEPKREEEEESDLVGSSNSQPQSRLALFTRLSFSVSTFADDKHHR